MILYRGKLYPNAKQEELLSSLYEDALNTLASRSSLDPDIVISACDKLHKRLTSHEYDEIVLPLLDSFHIGQEEYLKAIELLKRENLERKLERELGNPSHKLIAPLGILFHIAAGNFDVLPAYSVVEGLLAGNINILKLPTGDSGVSIELLQALIEAEPSLADYIYVFDIPSVEIESIKYIASFVNGIVVWGGDAVNEAVRQYAPINTKIISWGHKLSFAYVTPSVKEEELYKIARHIAETNQVLCSSVQGVYVDTQSEEELERVGRLFFQMLKKANRDVGHENLGMIGKNTFQLYAASLEEHHDLILNEEGVSVIIKLDDELELSYMFRNAWVKRLPRKSIVKTLHKHKEHLQTVALFCEEGERKELERLLVSAGVTTITRLDAHMIGSDSSHDGEYPLRRYSKIVEIE